MKQKNNTELLSKLTNCDNAWKKGLIFPSQGTRQFATKNVILLQKKIHRIYKIEKLSFAHLSYTRYNIQIMTKNS